MSEIQSIDRLWEGKVGPRMVEVQTTWLLLAARSLGTESRRLAESISDELENF